MDNIVFMLIGLTVLSLLLSFAILLVVLSFGLSLRKYEELEDNENDEDNADSPLLGVVMPQATNKKGNK